MYGQDLKVWRFERIGMVCLEYSLHAASFDTHAPVPGGVCGDATSGTRGGLVGVFSCNFLKPWRGSLAV